MKDESNGNSSGKSTSLVGTETKVTAQMSALGEKMKQTKEVDLHNKTSSTSVVLNLFDAPHP